MWGEEELTPYPITTALKLTTNTRNEHFKKVANNSDIPKAVLTLIFDYLTNGTLFLKINHQGTYQI